MKKIEAAAQFLEKYMDYFQCPVCRQEMERVEGTGIVCRMGHRFDLSRKGTLHLLQKGGQNEYDKEMLSNRKQLADTGFFHPLLDEVYQHLPLETSGAVLDVGCGEGSHLHYLSEKGLGGVKIGFDISKEAIQLAASHYFADAFWCVADLAQSPFAAGKFAAIMNVFSPSHYREFSRLLAPGGRVVKVVPAADYLVELRHALYADNLKKQVYDNEAVVKRFGEFFPDYERKALQYQASLTPESWKWLVEMTPLSWGASLEVKERVKEQPLAKVTVAVELLIGEKTNFIS